MRKAFLFLSILSAVGLTGCWKAQTPEQARNTQTKYCLRLASPPAIVNVTNVTIYQGGWYMVTYRTNFGTVAVNVSKSQATSIKIVEGSNPMGAWVEQLGRAVPSGASPKLWSCVRDLTIHVPKGQTKRFVTYLH